MSTLSEQLEDSGMHSTIVSDAKIDELLMKLASEGADLHRAVVRAWLAALPMESNVK